MRPTKPLALETPIVSISVVAVVTAAVVALIRLTFCVNFSIAKPPDT